MAAGVQQAAKTVVKVVSSATWICTAMRKAGVMTQAEIDELHDHLYRAVYDRPWSFIEYIAIGKFVVLFANMADIDWKPWKLVFYDIPIQMEDPIVAVDMYEVAFWKLTKAAWHKLTYQEIQTHD